VEDHADASKLLSGVTVEMVLKGSKAASNLYLYATDVLKMW